MNQNEIYKNNQSFFQTCIGSNPLPAPEILKKTLNAHSDKKDYTSNKGIPELNSILKLRYGENKKVLIGNGSKPLLFNLINNWEHRIVLITPAWPCYLEQINYCKKDFIIISANLQQKYKINPSQIKNNCKQNDLIIFNNPCNPTSVSYNINEIKKIAKACRDVGAFVLSDEIYLQLSFHETTSISNFLSDFTIISSSLSKESACGGYRLGWMLFPPILKKLYEKLLYVSNITYSTTSHPLQHVAIEFLSNVTDMNKHFVQSRNIFETITNNVYYYLQQNTKLLMVKPQSSWYLYLDFENYKTKLKKLGIENNIQLSDYLIDNLYILNIPGTHCGDNDHLTIRLSLVDINIIETNITVKSQNLENPIEKPSFIWDDMRLLKMCEILSKWLNVLE